MELFVVSFARSGILTVLGGPFVTKLEHSPVSMVPLSAGDTTGKHLPSSYSIKS